MIYALKNHLPSVGRNMNNSTRDKHQHRNQITPFQTFLPPNHSPFWCTVCGTWPRRPAHCREPPSPSTGRPTAWPTAPRIPAWSACLPPPAHLDTSERLRGRPPLAAPSHRLLLGGRQSAHRPPPLRRSPDPAPQRHRSGASGRRAAAAGGGGGGDGEVLWRG